MTFTVGCLFLIAGAFFLLRNTWLNYIYGIITLGNGANLTLFSIGSVQENAFPFVGKSSSFSDPLTQALILTAIVISFATLCFVISVIKKINEMEADT